MRAHESPCCQRAAKRGKGGGWATGGVIFAVLAALTPKCPMCIAAWLCLAGMSGLAAYVDLRVLWLLAALAPAAAGAWLVHRILT